MLLLLCAVNRRMDEWVTPDNFDLTTVEVEVLGEQAEGNRWVIVDETVCSDWC